MTTNNRLFMENHPQLGPFISQNPDFDLAGFSFRDKQAVEQLQWNGLDREQTVNLLKQYQRLLRIDPSPQVAEALLSGNAGTADAGALAAKPMGTGALDSAHKIASQSEAHFVSSYAGVLGEGKARQVYARAAHIQAQTMHVWANIHQMASPHYRTMAASPVSNELLAYYEQMPSYEEMFGSQNYCECDECKSIFGPAAYFVDLMRIIDQYATKPNAETIPAGMKLEERRPDLGNIELTCANTNDTMPYLTVVNERLESVVQATLPADTDLYPALAQAVYPFRLPFQLPLERMRIYLNQLQVSLAEVYSAFQAADAAVAAEKLSLSPEEWGLLTRPAADEAALKAYYGVDDLGALSDAATFLKQTGLKLTDLKELLYQQLSDPEVAAGIHRQWFINQGLASPLSLDSAEGKETIAGMNDAALDRIHRFLRLSAKLGWSFTELDWALHCAGQGAAAIDEQSLAGLAGIRTLCQKLAIPVADACSLIFDLKTYGVGPGEGGRPTPFDAAINGSGTSPYRPKDEQADTYSLNPLYQDPVSSWTAGANDDANRQLAVRLGAGLGLQPGDLTALATALFDAAGPIPLTVGSISALYRHTRLAALLRLSIPQYVKWLELSAADKKMPTAASVIDFLDLSGRMSRSRLTVYELDYAVSGTASSYVDTYYNKDGLDNWLDNLPLLAQSAETDPDAKKKEQDAKIVGQLASLFGTSSEQMKAVLGLVGPADLSAVFLDPAANAAAKETIAYISRWLVLVRKLRLTNDELINIQSGLSAYGIQEANSPTTGNVLDLFRMKEWRSAYGDARGAFLAYMIAADEGAMAASLVQLSGAGLADIEALLAMFGGTNRLGRFAHVDTALAILKQTGTDVPLLQKTSGLAGAAAAGRWSDYTESAETLLGAVRARLGQSDWDELFTQLEGEVQERKRTALMAKAINELGKKPGTAWIQNGRNLYEYLLIDVEMGGTARISYIKEALNAAQLYLIRCRERLEPGVTDFAIPEVWWEWMLNYRVWEANRQIFLYPENYIDPALRSSKTTLFKDLENTLKQGDITDESVDTAFRTYLDSFAELAKLKYVDAYYCNVSDDRRNDAPTLFLVARTETQPYKYYYIIREYEGTWSEWQEIGVTINTEYVTPVYVFNRLFVFWVEQKKFDENGSSDKGSQRASKATVKYSFANFSGQWVQPQTLAEDVVISVEGSDFRAKNDGLLPIQLFDAEQLFWKKVYPLKIETNHYLLPGAGTNRFEKLVLMYGPMLEVGDQTKVVIQGTPTSADPTLRSFEDRLYELLQHMSTAKESGSSGFLPVVPPIVLNDDLAAGFLANPDEFIVLENEAAASCTYFRPEIDRSAGRLNLLATRHLIRDNYYADQPGGPSPVARPGKLTSASFVSAGVGIEQAGADTIYTQLVNDGYLTTDGIVAEDLDFAECTSFVNDLLQGQPNAEEKAAFVMNVICNASGTAWLSSAMRNKEYGLFTVKNHPTAFVFKGDKEFILLLAPDDKSPSISRALFNADTLFKADEFVSGALGIDAATAQTIVADLTAAGALDGFGRLQPSATTDSLTAALKPKLNPDQTSGVINVLMLRPRFKPDSFVVAPPIDIQPAGSQNVFNQLVNSGYLDLNGRLDADIDFYELEGDVNELLKGQPNQDQKVRYVVDTLYQHAFPSGIGFFDGTGNGCGSCGLHYDAIRLTTAAVHRLSGTLFTGGIDALLSLESQQIPVESELPFERFAFTDTRVTAPEAVDGAQVDFSGAYGPYYWELFFHGPLYIAGLLKTNRRFQDAERWYQFIFNPTVPPAPLGKSSFVTSTMGVQDSERVYQVLLDQMLITADGYVSPTFTKDTKLGRYLPFLTSKQVASVKNILLNAQLSKPSARYWQFQPFRNRTLETLEEELQNPYEIAVYNKDPFDPHAVARLRNGAYEKSVIMMYVDNLLQWGDSEFSQYTWESIVSATMHYVYAYNLLGERPENLGPCETPPPATFNDIKQTYQDEIPQFLIELEHDRHVADPLMEFSPVNALDTYFGVPENENFISYWDRVEDRLYKIRHGLNILGIPQPLALFEPPIDPNLLVIAASAGGDALSRLAQSKAGIPYYRFAYVLERAKYVAAACTQLGGMLQSALEKKDAEHLAALLASNEKNLLNLTTLMKEKQIEEAKEMTASLNQGLLSAQARNDHYKKLYDENINALEIADLTLRGASLFVQSAAILTRGLTIAGYLAPKIFGLANGNMQFGDAINAGAQMLDGAASILDHTAGMIGTSAQYVRRREDWGLQRDTAGYEVEQLNRQIAASEVRVAILQRELEVHLKNIEQEEEYIEFLQSKFTNEDLYQWMVGRLATVYYQTYSVALDMAFAAEQAYQHELNRMNERFIQFDYWDSLHRGLLAGESLMLALHQMEKAYMDNNVRDMEIEKTVSLLHLDPVQFIAFREGINGSVKGQLNFELSEKLFDFDYPGHYARKIKSISVSIPAVVGPYQNINATLVQNSSKQAVKPALDAVKYLLDPKSNPSPSDGSVRENVLPNQQIALSRGMNDSGLFVLDFRDEKYLPFEGTGAVSSWTLSIPPETNRVDFANISDVILKVQYTAKDGGSAFADSVKSLLRSETPVYPYMPVKMIDLAQAYAGEWFRFLHTPPSDGVQQIQFPLTDGAILPNLQNVMLLSAEIMLIAREGGPISDPDPAKPFVSLKIGNTPKPVLIRNNCGSVDLSDVEISSTACALGFTLSNAPSSLLSGGALSGDALQDVVVVVTYQSNVFAK